MARTIPYRDLNGYIIKPIHKPVFHKGAGNLGGSYSKAVLAFCPKDDGLKHIGECEKCEFFRGHIKFKGVKCASTSQNEPPCYYNKINPKKDY